ncbi:MAG: ammonium transporter [Solirubrobacterales bacterium]
MSRFVGRLFGSLTVFALVLAPVPAMAAAQPIDTGDTTFVLMSAALVLLMTPGLAFFYGGMVRRKNVLSIIMHCFVAMAVVSITWVLFGYSLAFGPDAGHVIGRLDWLGMNGVSLAPNPDYAATIPHQAFAMFQLMFAIITPALIAGAFAERIRFSAFVVFLVLWSTFIYAPLTHWVWGTGGWLKALGVLDFAGGNPVEIASGFSSLAAAIVVGRRMGYGREPMLPHNSPLTLLGAGLLWFGWFGFNAGSALAANGVAVAAFVATNTAAAAAALAWMAAEWILQGRPTTLGAVSGAVAGMVAITPACGYVTPLASILIGLMAGIACFYAVSRMKPRLGYDDSLDVFGIHGVGGIIGTLATGLFATTLVNPGAANGLLYGNPHQFVVQLIAVLASGAFCFIGTFGILKGIALIVPLRATVDEEESGLDVSHHGEDAYRYDIPLTTTPMS